VAFVLYRHPKNLISTSRLNLLWQINPVLLYSTH